MISRLRKPALVVVAAFAWIPAAHAFQFTPTDAEWVNWSDSCKAKYVWTNIGKKSKFANLATPAQKMKLKRWEDNGIRGLHHYCAGSIWLQRARLERDPVQRGYMLRNASGETQFSFERSNRASPLFASIAVQMAAIMHEKGEDLAALDILRKLIPNQPTNDTIYSATAILERRLGNLEGAKETLLRGHQAVGGRSAEICYNLGLILIELGEIDEAEKYAKLAYELGYPLPGLRAKLERLSRMSR